MPGKSSVERCPEHHLTLTPTDVSHLEGWLALYPRAEFNTTGLFQLPMAKSQPFCLYSIQNKFRDMCSNCTHIHTLPLSRSLSRSLTLTLYFSLSHIFFGICSSGQFCMQWGALTMFLTVQVSWGVIYGCVVILRFNPIWFKVAAFTLGEHSRGEVQLHTIWYVALLTPGELGKS